MWDWGAVGENVAPINGVELSPQLIWYPELIVVVLEEAQYKTWIASKKTFKDNYMAMTAAPAAPEAASGADSTAVKKDTVSVTMN